MAASAARSGARALAGSTPFLRRATATGATAGFSSLSSNPKIRLAQEISYIRAREMRMLKEMEYVDHAGGEALCKTLDQTRGKDMEHLILASKRRSDVIRRAGIATGLSLGFGSILLLCGLEDIPQEIRKEQQEEKGAAKEKEVALA